MVGSQANPHGHDSMHDNDADNLRAAIAALEVQRSTLGDVVLELAVAPLRARLSGLLRPVGLKHRQVAVLFVDVVGSTAMAHGLDAEDTLEVLGRALRNMADIVQAHQGRVLRFTGDGVKAAFGMDEAREDDAERAVRAGLAMLAAVRKHAALALRLHGVQDFTVRVGVHTGDVALGAGIDADNTAVGAAVHIAARMEQSAPPGALRISHDTWNHVRGLFAVEPQPPLQVKGVAAPMQTYLVHGALDRHVAGVERGLPGLSTPMVGRGDELKRLLGVVDRASATRQLQALTLVGDAGLGKSRLLREMVAGLQDGRVIAVRSQPDGMLRPWGLLRSLLAVQCSVADTDSAELARRKVEEGLAPWFDARGERQAQLIGQLSGLDFSHSPHVRGLDPRSLRDQAFAAVRGYLQALAARGPALPVLVVEDLHWADDGSLDLLQHLLTHAAELPLVLLMTARPALLGRRADWGTPDTIVQLTPLAPAQSDALAQALLQRLDTVPPKLSELIVGQAEGNPYYMEELVRRLIDDGVIVIGEPDWTVQTERLQRVRLPGTLVGLLQARLDALPTGARTAARQASVIGHVFWDDALQALDVNAPQALPALQRAAFVRANQASDFEGTTERRFDHHLLHQVTYDTLLKAERRRGHGAVARWLTARTQGRGAEFLAMTGEHAERAGETALAIDCFEQAGKEAQKRFANSAAIEWLRRAVGLLSDSTPKRRFDLLQRVEKISDTMGDRPAQDAVHAEMAALLDRHPDDGCRARLLFCMALLAERRGDRVACECHVRPAIEWAERCEDAVTAARSHVLLAWMHTVRRDHAGAGRHSDASVLWAGRIEAVDERDEVEAVALLASAQVSGNLCRFDEARETLLRVLSRAQALNSPRLEDHAIAILLGIAQDLGQFDQVLDLAKRLHALAHATGALQRVAAALYFLAEATESLGDPAAAIGLYEQALPICRTTGDREKEAHTLFGLGRSHLAMGDAGVALQWYAQAQCLYQAVDLALDAGECAARAARCQVQLGQPAAALSTVNALLDRLGSDLAQEAAGATIALRWACQQVLDAVGDARARGLLKKLHADVQAHAAKLTDAADRGRLIQALPVFRAIVAAHGRPGEPGAAG